MEQFLVSKSVLSKDELQKKLKAVAAESANTKRARQPYSKKAWATWTDEKRETACNIFAKGGMKAVKLHFGREHPPQTTIRHWADGFANGQKHRPVSRPSLHLS